MPLYFAYGSNMDRKAMALRCPGSRALGRARLAHHRFFIMGSGFASVKCDPRLDVHGALYELSLSDIPRLDRYEEIGRGLYSKAVQPVLRDAGAPVQTLIYIGSSQVEGKPAAAYLDAIIAAARNWALPDTYLSYLASLADRAIEAKEGGGVRAVQLKGSQV
jgi:gamma-glutamylcyclotransferase (GGCT)/AIG2-like uncharacterized protein YtfP